LWTDRQMKLVHEITPEEGVIDFTAALAQEALHLPYFAQPVEGGLEIHFGFSEDRQFSTQVAQLSDPTFVSSLSCENDDRREALFENFGLRIYCSQAAGDDPQIVLRQSALLAQ